MLTSDTKFFAIDGNDVTLTCDITLDSYTMFVLAFEYNGKKVEPDSDHVVTDLRHDEFNKMKGHINLTIHNVKKSRDEGDYKCIVMDHFKNTNSITKSLIFVDKPDVNFTLDNGVLSINKGKKQARFLINYSAFPEPIMFIFNPRNEQISADHDVMQREKYDVKIEDQQIRFAIKYPDINDFGNYTIIASSAGKNFSTSVRLIVREKPTVHIEDAYVRANEAVNMVCRVIAFPVATISWGNKKSTNE